MTRDGTVTVHHRNLRVLAMEKYRISHDQSPKFMKNLVEEIDIPSIAQFILIMSKK